MACQDCGQRSNHRERGKGIIMKTKHKMTKAQQRVAIAKDAIAQIRAGAIVAESGVYVRSIGKGGESFSEKDVGKDIRDVLKVKFKKCEACAKGALLISTIRKLDNMPVVKTLAGLSIAYELEDKACWNSYESPFSTSALDLMESAFEGMHRFGLYGDHKYRRWYTSVQDDSDRLLAILRNIVANNGTFRPSQLKAG
jgi:hypothetical protein